MGRGILRGAGGDENLKSNFIWPYVDALRNMVAVGTIGSPTKGVVF